MARWMMASVMAFGLGFAASSHPVQAQEDVVLDFSYCWDGLGCVPNQSATFVLQPDRRFTVEGFGEIGTWTYRESTGEVRFGLDWGGVYRGVVVGSCAVGESRSRDFTYLGAWTACVAP